MELSVAITVLGNANFPETCVTYEVDQRLTLKKTKQKQTKNTCIEQKAIILISDPPSVKTRVAFKGVNT